MACKDEIQSVDYQARMHATHRPCGHRPCDLEFPALPARWCQGCIIAALLKRFAPILGAVPDPLASQTGQGNEAEMQRLRNIGAMDVVSRFLADAAQWAECDLYANGEGPSGGYRDRAARAREAHEAWLNRPSSAPLASQTGQEDWQPIETAPKDADAILLFAEGWGVQPGYWYAMDDDESEHRWIAVETQGLTGGRFGDSGPTHWKRLSDPPSSAPLASSSAPQGEKTRDEFERDRFGQTGDDMRARAIGVYTTPPRCAACGAFIAHVHTCFSKLQPAAPSSEPVRASGAQEEQR